MTERQTITIQHTEDLSADELETQKFELRSQGWNSVGYRMRPDLASPGWKAFEWTGIRNVRAQWVEDIVVSTYDPDEAEILEAIAEIHEIKGLKVLDRTAAIPFEDAYLIYSVEIEIHG